MLGCEGGRREFRDGGVTSPTFSHPTNRAHFVLTVFGERLDDGHRKDEQLLGEPSYVLSL